ncbi:MAG TPA: protein phosphatase 2C domain-containing protein [Longimicrobiales bacterium]
MKTFEFDARPIRIAVSGRSDRGRARPENQDHFLVADLSATPSNGVVLLPGTATTAMDGGSGEFALGPKGALIVVTDGMGGAAAGALASRLGAAWIHEEMVARWSMDGDNTPHQFASRLRESVEAANARVHQESLRDPRHRGMGTTATAVGVLDSSLYLAQVGDSRAYLVRGGTAVQLTRDQSLVQQLVEAGALAEEEAELSRHRSVILQALGTAPSVEVELTYQETRRGDVVVLCSDGLYRVVQRDEIGAAIAGMADPADAAARLVALANERGGPDNVTVVIVRLDGAGLEDPAADDFVGRQVLAWP